MRECVHLGVVYIRVVLYKYTHAYTYTYIHILVYTRTYKYNTWTTYIYIYIYIYPNIIIFMYLEKLGHLPIEKCKGERKVSVAS